MKVAFGHLCILLSTPWCWASNFLGQICWDCIAGARQSNQAPRLPTALLHFPACARDTAQEEALPRGKHRCIVLKKNILSPQDQRGEETSMCLCHLVWQIRLASSSSLILSLKQSRNVVLLIHSRIYGEAETGCVGLQLMLSLCSMLRWVELGRSPVAAMWAVTGDNPLAPLKSWKPTSMQSLFVFF